MKDKWVTQTEAMIDGESTATAAKRCGVDYKTAFRWRQRWSGFSKQRFAFDKWNTCRLMLRCRYRGVVEATGFAHLTRPEGLRRS